MSKKLTRNMGDKMVAGVASGLAEYFQLDVTWVRIAFALAVFFGGGGFLIYIILWIALPEKYGSAYNYTIYKESIKPDYSYNPEKVQERNSNIRTFGGLVLVVLGTCFLLDEFDLIPDWFSLSKLWPLVLVGLGVAILIKNSKSSKIKEDEANPTVEEVIEEDKKDNEEPTQNL